ncbi:hypothetical protein [Streptomyces sp. NPDC017673]|uniref:hypothetical protein n=1 Tax=unclassified Streptomyces TaxID=2593676 RepID=UPI003797630B
MQYVARHGVVEGVPADVVGRLGHRGDGGGAAGERRGRGEVPLHLGCHGHGLGPDQAGVGVAEPPLAQQQQRCHGRQRAQGVPGGLVIVVGIGAQHTQTLHTVGDGHPPAQMPSLAGPSGLADEIHSLEGQAPHRPVDGRRQSTLAGVEAAPGDLAQQDALEIDEKERHLVQAHRLGVVGHHLRQFLQRGHVAAHHQVDQ